MRCTILAMDEWIGLDYILRSDSHLNVVRHMTQSRLKGMGDNCDGKSRYKTKVVFVDVVFPDFMRLELVELTLDSGLLVPRLPVELAEVGVLSLLDVEVEVREEEDEEEEEDDDAAGVAIAAVFTVPTFPDSSASSPLDAVSFVFGVFDGLGVLDGFGVSEVSDVSGAGVLVFDGLGVLEVSGAGVASLLPLAPLPDPESALMHFLNKRLRSACSLPVSPGVSSTVQSGTACAIVTWSKSGHAEHNTFFFALGSGSARVTPLAAWHCAIWVWTKA
ncbi:hypothetical protein FI667_g14865, partial [Globisporangium splendens]